MSIVFSLFSTANTAADQPDDGGSQLEQKFFISIPPLNAAEALNRLAKQTGAQLLFPYELALTRNAHSVVGHYAVMEALNQLLQGSGLESSLSNKGAITISDSESVSRANQRERNDMNIKTKKSLLATLIAFFATGAVTQGVMAQDVNNDGQTAKKQNQIDEIIVTASKGATGTSLQDTAMAISALGGDTIEKRGLVGMDDYLRTIPGVSMQDRGAGQNSIVIRGLSADPQQDDGTAGVYFGEVPTSDLFSVSSAGNAGNADIKLVDIDSIEVLRGPQGTLYGSGSMGGTVRIIPASPNLNQMEGKLAARYSQTGEEGGDNTMIQAVLNVPLIEDRLAVRGVVYQFDNSGYIQNVAASQPVAGIATTTSLGGIARDKDDIGNDSYTGFRLAALWQATEDLDVTLSYLQQDIEQEGSPDIDLGLEGDYQQRRFNTGAAGDSYEFLQSDIDIISLVANYDFDWGTLTSASSWVNYEMELETDLTHITFLFGPTLANNPFYSDATGGTDLFTEELRLSSKLDGPLQFLVGLYYEDREREQHSPWLWSGDPLQAPGFQLSDLDLLITTKQKALFTEVSYALSEQVTATFGGRYFDYEKDEQRILSFFGFPTPTRTPTDETGQTYKANLSYTPNDNTLVYGQWAEGFRLGRGQAESINCITAGTPTPTQVDPDTSENFELGFKTTLADDRVTLNTALYRIDWEGIPVTINPAGACFYTVNAGKAKSEGVEVELQTRLTESLQLDLSASYGESTLEEDSSVGNKGDNLPGSADVNASLGLQYDFMLADYSSFVRIDYAYVGEYYSNTAETGTPAGDFGQLNLKAGISFDQVAVDLFVNNATNDDGLTWVDSINGLFGVNRANRIRPRTIGLNINYQF